MKGGWGLSGLQRSWVKQAGGTAWKYCMVVLKVSLAYFTLPPKLRTGQMQ